MARSEAIVINMEWINAPGSYEITNLTQSNGATTFDHLSVHALAKSDFWRKTHYGFIRDNGHFFYTTLNHNFEVTVSVTGNYQTLYDQGGLMIRQNEENWVKLGIEFVDGVQNVSAVVTRDFSDWSVIRLVDPPSVIHFKLKLKNGSFEVFYSVDGDHYFMYRTGYLTSEQVQVGVMCCSPDSETGFDVEFKDFKLVSIE